MDTSSEPTTPTKGAGQASAAPTRELVPVKEITITRSEGPSYKCNIKHTYASFYEAHRGLLDQSYDFPASGGYDKHEFTVIWADGMSYEGRLDCKHPSCTINNDLHVDRHIKEMALFMTGQAKPRHLTENQYWGYINTISEKERNAYQKLLDKYLP